MSAWSPNKKYRSGRIGLGGQDNTTFRQEGRRAKGRRRYAVLGETKTGDAYRLGNTSPGYGIARAIQAALDPDRVLAAMPRKVRTLADMGADEIAAIEKQYGAMVKK